MACQYQVIGGAPNLDMMLGDLQENMNKQGVRIKQKGVCGACGKPIVGQVVTALGRTWHPECFTCNECNQVRETDRHIDFTPLSSHCPSISLMGAFPTSLHLTDIAHIKSDSIFGYKLE